MGKRSPIKHCPQGFGNGIWAIGGNNLFHRVSAMSICGDVDCTSFALLEGFLCEPGSKTSSKRISPAI